MPRLRFSPVAENMCMSRSNRKRSTSVRFFLPFLLATACTALLVPGAGQASGRPDPAGAARAIIPDIPETIKPLCGGPLDGGGEPYATRFPKEYQDWEGSVHGRAYLSGNADAPGCTGCHDDPRAGDFRSPSFRLDIPARCARCHADEQRMRKYEIASDVYDTYRADYHGWTIDYYRNHHPTEWRFETVCSDCHRSHAIYPSSDRRSSIAPKSLLGTCRRCHPQAQANFASITTGHFRTDRKTAPLAYYIKKLYGFLIPAVIGLMAAYVGLDSVSRLRKWLSRTIRSWQSR